MATGALVAFTAISAGASIVKGIQSNSAATEQGIAYMRQAQIAQYENQLAVKQKQREIDKAAARQVMAMSKNGMDTSSGSPLEILYETMTLGQEEVDALKAQGAAQVNKYTSEANASFKSGRTALIGGVTDAVTTVASAYLNGSSKGLWGSASKTASSSSNGITLTGWTPSIFNTSSSSSTGYSGTLPSL